MVASTSNRKSVDLAARSVFPIAIIVFTVLIMIAAAIVWSSRRAGSESARLQRIALSASIGATRIGLEAALLRAISREGERDSLAALVAQPHAMDSLDIVGITGDGASQVLAVRDGYEPKDGQALAGAIADDISDRRFLRLGDELYVTATVPAAGQQVIFGASRIDERLLRAWRQATGLQDLNLEFEPERLSRANAVSLRQANGQVVAGLVWTSQNAGRQLLRDLLPVIIFGAAVLFFFTILIFMHIRRMLAGMLKSEQDAKHLAGHDPLTGLANRTSFMEQLGKELARLPREDTGAAVMFIDLDKFKDVNDTLGHAAGDSLLTGIGRRLSEQLRGSDTIARLGGDEFAIVQTQVRSLRDVEVLARRLIDTVQEPFDLDGAEIYIGVSIGIVVAPENGTNAEDLMRFADVALYRSKQEGRNRFSFFEPRMDESVRMRKMVENDLRAAIHHDDFQLLYQPQVSCDGSRICAVEALVRWNHPTQGLISPDSFIPLAEERGLIVPLGEWVLRRAVQDALAWPGINVSINVSAVQFKQRDFVATVGRVLDETGFPAHRLEIELTESIVIENADGAEDAMMELRAMGVRLALDDFGTGYSSLIYLRRFAFDKIKIDKSFLESMEATGESAILVHSVVHLGRALGLTVVAEGVETIDQQRFLQAVGCHQLQGFYFSRPVSAHEITRLLLNGRIDPAVAA